MEPPRLNACAERTIAMLDAAGLAAHFHAKESFLGVPANVHSLWGETLRWADDAFNQMATSANPA